MENQKTEDLLNLAVDATAEERAKSLELDVGYESEARLWEVIIKYSGVLPDLAGEGITIVPLLNGYAVATVPQDRLDAFINLPYIEYVEKPKRLSFAVNQARAASCITPVQIPPLSLSGRGIRPRGMRWAVSIHLRRLIRLWRRLISGRLIRSCPAGIAAVMGRRSRG